jgi:hypothetical protein
MEPIFFMEIFNYTPIQNTKKTNNEEKQNNLCNHEFVKDMIDITPEKSMNICYCVKCGFTQ